MIFQYFCVILMLFLQILFFGDKTACKWNWKNYYILTEIIKNIINLDAFLINYLRCRLAPIK